MAVKRLLQLRPQYDDGNGALASNYRLFFYAAGSSTKQNTYSSSTGGVANSNPITLNALGEPGVEIWGTVGQTYKIGLAIAGTDDPPASFIWTEDNVSPINDTTVTLDEWVSGPTPTFVSTTQFTLSGDQTTTFAVGRRLKLTVTAGTVYGRITASVFTTLTTVTVVLEPSQVLDSGLSAVSYALLSTTHPSVPWVGVAADTVSTIASAATLNLDANARDYAFISGTTTVTAITLAQSKACTVEFQGALTLTNGAALILPGGANITTAAGDTATFRGEASGVVRCIAFTKANGKSVINTANTQPTRQVFTSGSGTYTTPAGATRINVRLVGGGGGGAGSGAGGTSGGVGGNTTFGTLTGGGGGGGGPTAIQNAGTGGTATGGDINLPGGTGGGGNSAASSIGGAGGNTAFGGGAGSSVATAAGNAAAANTGGGGGGSGQGASGASSGGGGGGGYVEKLIVTPAATYAYAVGAAGSVGVAGTSGSNGGAAAAGIIIVDEFYD